MRRMSKRSRGPRPTIDPADVPVVGPREPCPCGSGKRYKVCHGRAGRTPPVERPFSGLAGETDWIALREFVPAGTAPLTLAPALAAEHPDRPVTLATVLPGAVPAMARDDGSVLLGVQTTTSSGDPSRDVAAALLAALAAQPGTPVTLPGLPGPGPRLQDVLDPSAPLVVTVHDTFDYWAADRADDPQVAALIEQANTSIIPTTRLASVPAAYVAEMGERRYVRWVQPYAEDPLLDALARLRASGADRLVPGTTLLGTFRAHGLLVPVWELDADVLVDDLEDPTVEMAARLAGEVEHRDPLDADARRARAALANRQITLR
jgi:hypothetical protein